MAVKYAYVMPHPPLAVPSVGGGKETVIAETVQAMDEIAAEIARVRPETIIFISPHAPSFAEYFHVSPGDSAAGDFSRFGVAGASLRLQYDGEMIAEISRLAAAADFPAGTAAHADPALDHGVLVPLHYIARRFSDFRAVRVSPSGLDLAAHFEFGKILAAAAENRRVVIIASGDLSHKLAHNGPYGFAPEGEVFDRDVMGFLREADFGALLSMDAGLREKAAECGFGAFAILSGALDGGNIAARQLSYECPFGVGYGVIRFVNEDAYRALARKSLECRVKTGKPLVPGETSLPAKQAGAFVSLHIDGQLRGCIGTIAPTKATLAEEIISNAQSAGLYDSRFPPVHESELPHLTYKVDILDEPEDISGPEALDVQKYGVIVESGFLHGLLLPNLEGVDSVVQQIQIACQKAGIAPGEPCNLKRFKVTRYE